MLLAELKAWLKDNPEWTDEKLDLTMEQCSNCLELVPAWYLCDEHRVTGRFICARCCHEHR